MLLITDRGLEIYMYNFLTPSLGLTDVTRRYGYSVNAETVRLITCVRSTVPGPATYPCLCIRVSIRVAQLTSVGII